MSCPWAILILTCGKKGRALRHSRRQLRQAERTRVRYLAALTLAIMCVLAAPAGAAAQDPTNTTGDYEPGASAPAFTPGDDDGVGFPEVPGVSAELPFTGLPLIVVVFAGIMLLSVGVLVRRFSTQE